MTWLSQIIPFQEAELRMKDSDDSIYASLNLVDNEVRGQLTSDEQQALNCVLSDYLQGEVTVCRIVDTIVEIFNAKAKVISTKL